MTKILIVGYGNDLRRDDGLGSLAVKLLKRRNKCEGCLFLTHHQPYPETVNLMRYLSHVVFIDARVGETPGEITVLPVQAVDAPGVPEAAPHHLALEWLLWMTRSLYGHKPDATVFTITGQDFGLGEGISDCVLRQIPRLIEMVEGHIFQCMNAQSPAVSNIIKLSQMHHA